MLIRNKNFVSVRIIRTGTEATCLYRDWNCLNYGNMSKLHEYYRERNCLQYGNIAKLRVFTGTGNIFFTLKL